MRSLSLTMPAALLLLLCLACNNPSKQKAEALSVGQANDREMKAPSSRTNDVEAKALVAETDREVSGVMSSSADSAAAGNAGQQPDDQSSSPKPPGGRHSDAPANNSQQAAPANPDWDKKIIKTANLQMEVKNYKSFTELLHRAVQRTGGYIAQEEQNESGYKIENTVTIKVPVDRFDEALSQLGSDSDKLVGKKITTEDVSMEIVDSKSRLETKRQVRERYLDLLKQARNMNEILKVQNEINDIQEQMEGAAGRIAYLGHSAALSTINLNFYQVLDPGAKNEPEPSFLYKIKGAFADGWNWSSSVLIGLIGLWPLWIGVGLAWMGVRKWRVSFRSRPVTILSGAAAGSPKADAAKV